MTSTLVQLLPVYVIAKWYLLWVIRHSHFGLYNSSGYMPILYRLELVHNHWTASSLSLGSLTPHEFFKLEILVFFCNVACTCTPAVMWCTNSRYVCLIRFHCVSLTSCAEGEHSTFDSSSERSCRGASLSSGEWQQCSGTEQCRLTKTVQLLSILLSCTIMFAVVCGTQSVIRY